MTTGKTLQASDNSVYRRMIEEIEDYAIIMLDRKGFIQNWNRGAQKIKQYTEQEVIGKHFSIFYLPEDTAAGLPETLLGAALRNGRAYHEGWRKRKDGSRFWGSITITAIHDDEGETTGFCKVTRDLTDQKHAADNLRESEERYARMVAEVQDYAIILLDSNGIIKNWNAGAEKIKGYKAEEIIGQRFDRFYSDADRESGLPYQLLGIATREGRATHEGWRIRKDGTRFWGGIIITALHDPQGNVIGFTKVTRDLTQKKIAEDKLAAYTAELEQQNHELEQFAYVASHDLQEPLRKILAFSELIRGHIDDRNFVDRYFAKLEASAMRMSELIRALLAYSRIGRDDAIMDEVDLSAVLAEVTNDLELLIEEKQAVINIGELPVLRGNHVQLRQLFFNLMSNALKFCEDKPVITVTAEKMPANEMPPCSAARAGRDHYRIDVKDNGIGFEPKYADLIFSLFRRLHGQQEYAGTGIGLALCKKICDNHHGCISAQGTPGEGSIFSVWLPSQHR